MYVTNPMSDLQSCPESHPGVEILLTLAECLHAASVGAIRQYESFTANLTDRDGLIADCWGGASGVTIHVEGAAGEIATARALGLYYPAHVNNFHGPDLGVSTQVRTRYKHDYDLLIRSDDDERARYFLVTGTMPRFWVRGWLWGYEAKQSRFIQRYAGRQAAWFVPVNELHQIKARRT
jgi:hypothetical protein